MRKGRLVGDKMFWQRRGRDREGRKDKIFSKTVPSAKMSYLIIRRPDNIQNRVYHPVSDTNQFHLPQYFINLKEN